MFNRNLWEAEIPLRIFPKISVVSCGLLCQLGAPDKFLGASRVKSRQQSMYIIFWWTFQIFFTRKFLKNIFVLFLLFCCFKALDQRSPFSLLSCVKRAEIKFSVFHSTFFFHRFSLSFLFIHLLQAGEGRFKLSKKGKCFCVFVKFLESNFAAFIIKSTSQRGV